jgi:hypothetical protein
MMGGLDNGLVAAISAELKACRKRGIERLDLQSHNQAPVKTPRLQLLADEYLAASQRRVQGRTGQLKYLLRDALTAFADENESDAQLVRALFFGDSQHRVAKTAGDLLDIARRDSGFDGNDAGFRHARYHAFDNFAEFLPRFVVNAQDGRRLVGNAAEIASPPPHPSHTLAPEPEVERHVATTGYVDDGEHFITLLSEAERVTIVGFTNETLAPMLKTALDRKRAAIFRSEGFWDSLRIVFLGEQLLNSVNDERDYRERDKVLMRRRAAFHGRRTVSHFLRTLPEQKWQLYDSPYYPPLTGTLLEMPDGRRIVQLLFRRPQRSNPSQLYMELDDTRGHYFSATFDEIVYNSVDHQKMVVPVGLPVQQRFRITSARARQNVLLDGSQAAGWLALVLVITWRRTSEGRAEPLLQLRTQLTAVRELERLTHLPDYIVRHDADWPTQEFGLRDEIPMAAARRRVEIEAGEGEPGELEPVATCSYLHPDKEHLFFFIYGCQLPEGFQLWRQAEMHPVPVEELMSIREQQALRNAVLVCQAPPERRAVRKAAFEIAALNLTLHDHADIAQRLTAAATSKTADLSGLAADITDLAERPHRKVEVEVDATGLSGLQYREFFSILLPYYRTIGVQGAAEALDLISDDDDKRAAVTRLAKMYQDQTLTGSIPYEL